MFKSRAFMHRLPYLGSSLQTLVRPTKKKIRRRKFYRKRRLFRRKIRRTGRKKYEIKYSNQINKNAESWLTNVTAVGDIDSTANSPIPLLQLMWPDQGAGKQNMIGTQIYIRRLVLYITIDNTSIDWTTAPIRIVIYKSTELQTSANNSNLFTFKASGQTYDQPIAYKSMYSIAPLKQTVGKVVWDKKAIIHTADFPTSATSWIWPGRNLRNYKVVFKINKMYEKKLNSVVSPWTEFNHSGFYLTVIKPSTEYATGDGFQDINITGFFTYTDT